jgi:putative transposase
VAYWRTFYHLIWATKKREPLIGEQERSIIERSMKTTCDELDMIPHAVGFMSDHIHVAVSIPPKIAAADVVKRLKGASSHAVNHVPGRNGGPPFAWQGEYGLLTFEKALPQVIAYVQNQASRHADRRLWPSLERDEPEL